MELWIRSQDKEKLLKVNDIAIEINMIYGYFDKNTEYELLGTYATKERALEVLDEIQEFIQIEKQSFIHIDKDGSIDNSRYYDNVYEMPID